MNNNQYLIAIAYDKMFSIPIPSLLLKLLLHVDRPDKEVKQVMNMHSHLYKSYAKGDEPNNDKVVLKDDHQGF